MPVTKLISIKRAVEMRRPAANDDFARAQPMHRIGTGTGWEQLEPVDIAGNGMETAEPAGANWVGSLGYQSLWWKYEPAGPHHVSVRNGLSTFMDSTSSFPVSPAKLNIMMTAYDGGPGMGALTELDSTDSTDPSNPTPDFDPIIEFDVVAGDTYWIQVAAWAPGTNGAVILEWNLT
jgi:hypothetical protein